MSMGGRGTGYTFVSCFFGKPVTRTPTTNTHLAWMLQRPMPWQKYVGVLDAKWKTPVFLFSCLCFFIFFVVVFLLPFVCFWRYGKVPLYRLAPSGVFLMPFESYPEPFLNVIACRRVFQSAWCSPDLDSMVPIWLQNLRVQLAIWTWSMLGIQSLQGIEVFDPFLQIFRVDSKILECDLPSKNHGETHVNQ